MNNILLTTSDSVKRRLKRSMSGGVVTLKTTSVYTYVLIHLWLILVNVEGWTYHCMDNMTMTWNETREWCQKHYTDIVMVHNENVTSHLKNILKEKSSSPYYWIGLRKINSTWTWAANGQSVNYENWASNEPNNNKSDENCVELYISRTNNNGKWNDDSCKNRKHPVCHKAQCPNNCTDRQDCEEQVNNFTCVCKPGFSGPECETVVSCEPLSAPPHGWMECSGLYGNHSLNSNCKFSCAGGYKLNGTAELKCNSSGAWNAPTPSCAVVSCEPLSAPPHGWMECSGLYGNHSLNSICKFSCAGGYKLNGTAELRCNSSGAWNAPTPSCAVVSCEPLSAPPHGWMECSGLYGNHSLNSICKFSCAGGYKLNGTAELRCNSSGAWNAPTLSCAAECFPILLFGGGLMNCTEGHDSIRSACTVQCPPGHLLLGFAEFTCRADGTWVSSFPLMCASYVHFLIALLASVVISVFCGCLFCCSNCRRSKKAVRLRPQQETVNPAYEAEHTPLEGPLCSA